MNASTQAYLDLAKDDDALHVQATTDLRASVGSIAKIAQQGAKKGDAIFAVQCDEADPKIRGLLEEAQDKQKVIQRVVSDWQERTVMLMRVLGEVTDFDARFSAAASAATNT